jgi:Sulfotransferase family
MYSPLFVLGNPRSGTTLLRLMLNNHKHIVIPPECGFAVWYYKKYQEILITTSSIQDFLADLALARKIETWELDFNKLKEYLTAAKIETYSELVSAVYQFYGKSTGKSFRIWGDKNNFYIKHVDTIKKMFPASRLIHIVRDGRDVACSYKALNKLKIQSKYAPQLPDKITDIANEWITNLNCAMISFEKIGWENVYELRYEDLITHPVDELKKLCLFLNEPYDEEMQTYYLKNQLEHQEPPEFLQWKAKTVEKPTPSEIGKYMTQLTREEIGEFESIAFSLLRKYRYKY